MSGPQGGLLQQRDQQLQRHRDLSHLRRPVRRPADGRPRLRQLQLGPVRHGLGGELLSALTREGEHDVLHGSAEGRAEVLGRAAAQEAQQRVPRSGRRQGDDPHRPRRSEQAVAHLPRVRWGRPPVRRRRRPHDEPGRLRFPMQQRDVPQRQHELQWGGGGHVGRGHLCRLRCDVPLGLRGCDRGIGVPALPPGMQPEHTAEHLPPAPDAGHHR